MHDSHTQDDYSSSFDPNLYREQNYDAMLPEDKFFIQAITQSTIIEDLGIKPQQFSSSLDIGNAGAMIAPGLMAPFVRDAGTMVLGDVAHRQLHLIDKTIRRGRRGYVGIWEKFEDIMAQNVLWDDAIGRACRLAVSQHVSLADLQPLSYDAASMFSVAECIATNTDDFNRAMDCFFGAVRPGGLVLWHAMVGSQGYESPGAPFSSFWIDPQDMIDVADDSLRNISLLYKASSGGARAHGGMQYSGMALLIGVKV